MHSEEPLLGHLYSHLAKFFGKCQKGPFLQIRSHIFIVICIVLKFMHNYFVHVIIDIT